MGISRGNITTNIIKKGLIFNMDAANRGSYPKTGTTATDTTNNLAGTLSGVAFIPSSGSGVWSFDGVDDNIDCGNQSSLSFTSNFSVCAWMKSSDQTSYAVAIGKTASYNGYSMQMRASDNKFQFNINVGGSWKAAYYSLSPIDNGNWYYVVGTHDGSTVKIYINAVKGTDASAGSASTNSNSFFIGAEDSGQYFKGNIGPVHVYDRVLSASEVLFNYNGLKSRFGL